MTSAFGVFAFIAVMLATSTADRSPPKLKLGFSVGDFSVGMQCENQRAVEAKNKKLVVAAYQALFGDYDFDSVDKYFRPDYIQHSPNMADGPEALKEFARAYSSGQEKKKVDIRKVSAEGNLVWLHVKNGKDGHDLAFMDCFRVEGGLIAEHWNVVQPIPDVSQSKNPHPMF